MKGKKLALTLLLTLAITPALASECDKDFTKHSESVLEKIVSNSESTNLLGEAQRDCLAIKFQRLQKGDSLCPAFRAFQREFLTLTQKEQIERGEQCFRELISKD